MGTPFTVVIDSIWEVLSYIPHPRSVLLLLGCKDDFRFSGTAGDTWGIAVSVIS